MRGPRECSNHCVDPTRGNCTCVDFGSSLTVHNYSCCQEVLVWGCTTPQKKIAREGLNFRSNSCTWLMKLTRYFLIRSCISFFQESFRVFNKRLQSVMSTNQGPRNRGAQRHGTPDFFKTRKCAHFS